MPPSFRVPPRVGAAVGLLTAVILGLLIGGVAGVALHERGEDDETAATATTPTTSGDTSSTTAAASPSSTATAGTGSGATPGSSGTSTTSSSTTSTTSPSGTSTSPTTSARGGAAPTLAHTGAPADLLLLGLTGVGLGLAARRTRTWAPRD